MWLVLAIFSAVLLGCYDSFKKEALRENAVIPILFLNTLFCSIIFLPFILLSYTTTSLDGTIFHVSSGGWEVHKYIVLKSCIVLLDFWLFWHEASSFDYCWTNQCHTPRDGTNWSLVGFWGEIEYVPMDRSYTCSIILFPVKP